MTAPGGQAESGGRKGRVLFVGHSYYHAWYLSRELRRLGWTADVLNIDADPGTQMYYHGEDFAFRYGGIADLARQAGFFARSLARYDLFHFSNAHCMHFGPYIRGAFGRIFGEYAEIRLLKAWGKKIVYSNNSCLDGVSQSSFSRWGPENVCEICRWRDVPEVCDDEKNLAWGRARNALADFQVLAGGNRADCNVDPRIHEVPEFYCLEPEVWSPDLAVPAGRRLSASPDCVNIYHAVGNFASRTSAVGKRNIKCTHIYVPLVERLKAEGHNVDLIFFHNVPNRELRYYQVQADIVVDMLTYGWFGANIREGMMLGKPCVCYLRPEWIEDVRREIPEYARELPVLSATPDTVYDVLKDLVENPEKRLEIGRRSRAFALKWHSAQAGARRFDAIYSALLGRS